MNIRKYSSSLLLFSLSLLFRAVVFDSAFAEVIYYEKDGMVVGEGEIYSSRSYKYDKGVTNSWYIVPDEAVGAGSFTNVRGGAFIQCLPDNGSGGAPNVPPEIFYKMYISTPGTYRLFLRRDGDSTDSDTIGQSDSMFFDIVELKDGRNGEFGSTNNLIADWYETTGYIDGDFSTRPWSSACGAETNYYTATWDDADWVIPAEGVYTLRFTQREDGAAVDAFVFQMTYLDAPTGDGPAMSLTNAPDTLICAATDDTYLARFEPDVAHGSNISMIVKNAQGTAPSTVDRNLYLRFDISDLDSIEEGMIVTDATLKIYLQDEGTHTNHEIYVAVISEDATAETFDEDLLTPNNSDVWSAAVDEAVDFTKIYGGAPVGSFTVSSSNEPAYMSFRSKALRDAINADSNGVFSVVLYREFDNVNFDYFSAKEHVVNPPPVLEIDYGFELGTMILIQ